MRLFACVQCFYTCVCICLHIGICTCAYVSAYTRVCLRVCAFLCTCVLIHVLVCMRTNRHVSVGIRLNMNACDGACVCSALFLVIPSTELHPPFPPHRGGELFPPFPFHSTHLFHPTERRGVQGLSLIHISEPTRPY